MKKITVFLSMIMLAIFFILPGSSVSAQGMMGQNQNTDTQNASTAADEAKGKDIFDKLQAKQVDCKSLTDDDFDILGDYFMGTRMGSGHETMNTMMTQMMGEEGEKNMHIAIGKRLSGCDTNAPIPTQGAGFLPMMGMGNMMGGGWGNGYGKGGGFPMMGNLYGNMMGNFGWWGILGLLTWFVFIVFLILGIVYFGKEINKPKNK